MQILKTTLRTTVARYKLAVKWGVGSAGPRLVGSICSGSSVHRRWVVRPAERQTGSSTGCNTRHERGGDAGPMSCVAAPGPANRSPSAQAGNSWSFVKRKTGRHRGRKWGGGGEIKSITIDSVYETEEADGKWEREWQRVVGPENLTGGERKMNEKGNRMKENTHGERMRARKRAPKGRCTSTDTTFITWPMKIAFFTLWREGWPSQLHLISTMLDIQRKNTPLAQIAWLEG